jgi:glucose-1-phosphate thymidylyltransferase
LKIACLEEIALDQGYMSLEAMERVVADMPNSTYRDYVTRVLEEHRSAP